MLGESWDAEAVGKTHATEMGDNAQNADLESKVAKQPKALPVAKAMLKSKPNRKSGHSEHLQTLLRKGTEEEAVELGEPWKTTCADLEANNTVPQPGLGGVCQEDLGIP